MTMMYVIGETQGVIIAKVAGVIDGSIRITRSHTDANEARRVAQLIADTHKTKQMLFAVDITPYTEVYNKLEEFNYEGDY